MISGLQFSGLRTLKFLRLQSEVTEKTNQIEVMRIARVSDFSSLILFHFIFSSPSFFLFSLSFYFLNIFTFHFISSPPLPSPSLPPLSPPLSLPPLPSSRPRPLLPSPPLPIIHIYQGCRHSSSTIHCAISASGVRRSEQKEHTTYFSRRKHTHIYLCILMYSVVTIFDLSRF